jgi:hypothetical protein
MSRGYRGQLREVVGHIVLAHCGTRRSVLCGEIGLVFLQALEAKGWRTIAFQPMEPDTWKAWASA